MLEYYRSYYEAKYKSEALLNECHEITQKIKEKIKKILEFKEEIYKSEFQTSTNKKYLYIYTIKQ